jgi:hypothetical protein
MNAQLLLPAVTTEGDEMQLAGLLITMETGGHGVDATPSALFPP